MGNPIVLTRLLFSAVIMLEGPSGLGTGGIVFQ